MQPVGRYIAVYGQSGSGKSTLAREIGARLGLPVFELDAIHHQPGWRPLPREQFRARVQEVIDAHPDGWVFDGNYSAVRDLLLPRAETAVWLQLPFWVVYPRLVRRTLGRMIRREELWNGNRESFRMSFFSRESILLWGITNWRDHSQKMRAVLFDQPHGARVMVLRSARDVERFLASLPPAARQRGGVTRCQPRPTLRGDDQHAAGPGARSG